MSFETKLLHVPLIKYFVWIDISGVLLVKEAKQTIVEVLNLYVRGAMHV